MTVDEITAELHRLADPEKAAHAQHFFKTGPGEYGEGDRFLGIRVPEIRKLARRAKGLGLRDVETLLDSEWHEARLLAVILLSDEAPRAPAHRLVEISDLYVRKRRRVNNWDLVDVSAPNVLGSISEAAGSLSVITMLTYSGVVWDRRIAMLATLWFTRRGNVQPALQIAEMLVDDTHDLMHKAVGWMLREVGKRDEAAGRAFLDRHAATMPRTMLRYAIERFPEPDRQHYLGAAARSA